MWKLHVQLELQALLHSWLPRREKKPLELIHGNGNPGLQCEPVHSLINFS